MTVALRVARHGDVAVISGVDTEPALLHLARSLVDGDAFADYPALLIDLRGVAELSGRIVDELAAAQTARLHRHQWLSVVRPDQTVPVVVAEARRWLSLVGEAPAHPRVAAVTAPARVVRDSMAFAVRLGVAAARWPVRRLLR
jgi:hypothetical protein